VDSLATSDSAAQQFSVKYLFPDTGIYEILTRVRAKEIAALAAFKVIIPLQACAMLTR